MTYASLGGIAVGKTADFTDTNPRFPDWSKSGNI
jgi:hypothetical protein